MNFVWPPIMKALDERAKKIADGLSAADKAKAELANANKRVEEQLAAARTDATQRLADAERLAQSMIEEAKGRASEEGAKIIAAAKAEAEQEAVKAREALREQVAALAVKGAEQILQREVNAGVHAELLGPPEDRAVSHGRARNHRPAVRRGAVQGAVEGDAARALADQLDALAQVAGRPAAAPVRRQPEGRARRRCST